jgi:hypothetical protein
MEVDVSDGPSNTSSGSIVAGTVQPDADWVLRVQRLCRAALEAPLPQAAECVDEAFVVIDRDGDESHPVFVEVLCTAADTSFAHGQLDHAEALYRRAEQVATWHGASADLLRACSLDGQAAIEIHRERLDLARLRLAEALQVLRRCGDDEAIAARVDVEARLRQLDTPDDVRVVGYGAVVRIAPDVQVARERDSQSLYAEESGSDGLHASAVLVDGGRIVRIAESHDGLGLLRLVGTGPRTSEWVIEARGFRCAWPSGTTLCACVRPDSSFELVTDDGCHVVVRGPYERDDLPALSFTGGRIVAEGDDIDEFVEIEVTDGEHSWRRREVRVDDALCVMVSAYGPSDRFASCRDAIEMLLETLHYA